MKEVALTLFGAPLLMALTMGLGMALGYGVGFIPGCVVVVGVALWLGVLLGKRTNATVGMLAVVFAALTGVMAALGCHRVRQLETRALARDVPLTEIQRFRTKDLLTLRDGESRVDLDGYASRVSTSGGASDRTSVTYTCEAYPIVPAGWAPSSPVPVWRLGDAAGLGAHHEVYEPGEPSEICRTAIDKAVAAHRLTTAKDAVYLKAMEGESADPSTNALRGPMALGMLGGSWIIVALIVVIKNRSARQGL